MVAYCGLDCSTCEAYIATMKNDDAERKRVSKEWSEKYMGDIPPESINCYGCTSEDKPVFYYCEHMCEIRKCARNKKVANCASCSDYICSMLSYFFQNAPDAKENLEKLRK